MRIGRAKPERDVYYISDAPKPLTQDVRSREAKYLMAMGVRTAAFLLIVILPVAWPWKLGLAALALLLPYVAVVYANGGREPSVGSDSPYRDPERRALTQGGAADDGRGSRGALGSRGAPGRDAGEDEADDADDADGEAQDRP